MDELELYRKEIDTIDREILALFGKRFVVTAQVGAYKRAHKLSPVDPQREAVLLQRIRVLSQEYGVDPNFAENIFRLTMTETVKNHQKVNTD